MKSWNSTSSKLSPETQEIPKVTSAETAALKKNTGALMEAPSDTQRDSAAALPTKSHLDTSQAFTMSMGRALKRCVLPSVRLKTFRRAQWRTAEHVPREDRTKEVTSKVGYCKARTKYLTQLEDYFLLFLNIFFLILKVSCKRLQCMKSEMNRFYIFIMSRNNSN